MRWEVSTAVRMIMMNFGFWRLVEVQVDGSVSEEHTVCIFRAEVALLESGRIYMGEGEGKAEAGTLLKP
jgi:hypothetical protein